MMTTKKTENVENVEITEKKAVNVLDLLLGSDCGKIQTPFKDVEISRLSEAFGSPFIVRCILVTGVTVLTNQLIIQTKAKN